MARYNEHVPNDGLRGAVTMMAAFRIPNYKIAMFLKIDHDTLTKHYRHELDNAETMVDAEVLQAWMKLVKKGDPLTVNRYIERKFAYTEDMPGVASERPSVVFVDNLEATYLPKPDAPHVIDVEEVEECQKPSS